MAKDAFEDDDLSKGDEYIKGSFSSSWRPNAHGGHHSYSSVLQRLSNRYHNFTSQTRASPLEEWEGGLNIAMSNTVTTAIRSSVRGMAIGKARTNDKADRATVENAIDPRTRMILYKMLSRGELENIDGCISTGKEANVYYATKSNGQELAIKTYKTSVLAFKDRVRYVDGDRRFTNDYCGSNHGKMVKTWAKKEMRNLFRVKAEGILCPTPYLRKQHVLVMEFIGKDGRGAPRLKDANLSLDKLREGYAEIIAAMRVLYQKCRLVHGDLSEYNILYHAGDLYIIDVSQAVDPDHPRALEFLIEDCIHVSDFFKRHGVGVMTIIELFVFIFDASIDSVDNYLKEVQQNILDRGEVSIKDEIADRTFARDYIAKKPVDVKIMSGKDILDLYYEVIPGLMIPGFEQHKQKSNTIEGNAESQSDEDEDNVSDSKEISSYESDHDTPLMKTIEDSRVISYEDEDNVSDSTEFSSYESDHDAPLMKKAARKEARKENKKKVKEEKREARKTKVPKTVKKRKLKKSKAPKTR